LDDGADRFCRIQLVNYEVADIDLGLKQHASRFMIIFMKILEMYLEVKFVR
jgi:hypothetical protein